MYFARALRLLYPSPYEVPVTVGTTYVVRIPGVPYLIELFDFAFKLVVEVVNWALACYQYYGVYIGNFRASMVWISITVRVLSATMNRKDWGLSSTPFFRILGMVWNHVMSFI